jgi:hypothetical protein
VSVPVAKESNHLINKSNPCENIKLIYSNSDISADVLNEMVSGMYANFQISICQD